MQETHWPLCSPVRSAPALTRPQPQQASARGRVEAVAAPSPANGQSQESPKRSPETGSPTESSRETTSSRLHHGEQRQDFPVRLPGSESASPPLVRSAQ